MPVNLKLEHIFSVSRSFFEPAVLAAFFLIFIMLIASFRIYKHSKKTFFLLAWIFITLLPVMNLVPFLRGSLLSEHYLYVPSIGFSVLLAGGVDSLSGFSPLRYWKNISKTLIVLILVFYSIVVIKRNADWKDEFGFWTKTVKDCPQSYISRFNLGLVYQERNQFEKAIEEYNTALRLYPKAYIVYDILGYIYQKKGDYPNAKEKYKEVLKLNPEYVKTLNNLGVIYAEENRIDEALECWKKALEIAPDYSGAKINLEKIKSVPGLRD
jgi:tetratricopeptide (TPR) repeat protein